MDRTPRILFLMVQLLHLFIVCSPMNMLDISSDQSALLSLKTQIDNHDPHNLLSTKWSMATSVCDWMGVTCSSLHHRVIALDISNMRLEGTIPPHLGNLSFLVSLDMSGNGFFGQIPQQLAHLRRLKIMDLGINNLSGEIPSSFAALSKLQHLFLDKNNLTGSIPPSLFNLTNLESLILGFNSLRGQIPQEIGNLQNLTSLSLANNRFIGSIPLTIFNISSLQTLSLSNNSLPGILPSNIFDRLQQLEILDLSCMNLYGAIPSSLCRCLQLQVLNLLGNTFSDSIPSSIANLTLLNVLDLSRNNLQGEIPKEVGSFVHLEELNFENNNLTGLVPSSIYNISSLKYLSYRQNKLFGTIPPDLCVQLPVIQTLLLSENSISGTIPLSIGNCTSLVTLSLGNKLRGVIPQEIGNLSNLEFLGLGPNSLSGHIPAAIFNLSKLLQLSLWDNNLSGSLPSTIGHTLPNLQFFGICSNKLSGVIPESMSNISQLSYLDLSKNTFTGFFPNWLGRLRQLNFLSIHHNSLSIEPSSVELSFFTHLTNCIHLKTIQIGGNPLHGILPRSVGNLSTSLQKLMIADSGIRGIIPKEISNISSLLLLELSHNELSGSVEIIDRVDTWKIQLLSLSNNKIRGSIPANLCKLKDLWKLDIGQNEISGQLPTCLGSMTGLRVLYLNSNKLTSILPASLWTLKDLMELDLSFNSFSGTLPVEIGSLTHLLSLSLEYNSLQGPIPDSMGKLLDLNKLDLSHNQLVGSIPKSLEDLSSLNWFNVSFNRLTGEIPSGGPFKHITSESFLSNEGLCGSPQFKRPSCPVKSPHKSTRKMMFLVICILMPITTTILAFILVLRLVRKYRKKNHVPIQVELLSTDSIGRISYTELHQATDGFDEINLIGAGSYGSVFKGIFNGKLLAVKVFSLQNDGGFKSFDRECGILCNLRHRNLAKVVTCCSTSTFKAIVLEYMANGSLEKWLYSDNYFLDILQRLDIMIDVGCALDYLHHGYSVPVVHCDLKPSNVLLDENMVAHVSDFGISKFLGEEQSVTQTRTLATIGYMAPEYGSEGLVSIRCDVYSYGIMLMETFSRRKPTENIFAGDLTLKSWISDSLPDKVIQIIDGNMIKSDDVNREAALHCVTAIMKLSLVCTAELPEKRKDMKDVVAQLKKIREMFVSTLCRI